VEVKVGVRGAPREIVIDSPLTSVEIHEAVRAALATPDGVLVLADDKGREVLVPGDKLAFVEIGEMVERRVGFGQM